MELNREHFRAMIFYDFRRGLTQQQCADQLASTFGDGAPSRATVFRWYSVFNRGRSSLQDEFREGRPKSVVVPENINAVRELISQDRHVTYREIEARLGISSTRIHSILHKHLENDDLVKAKKKHTYAAASTPKGLTSKTYTAKAKIAIKIGGVGKTKATKAKK